MGWWFRMDLWKRVLVGLVLGAITGIAIREGLIASQGAEAGIAAAKDVATYFEPFGKAFIALIKMLVVPLIFTTLVSGVLAMGDPKKLGSLGGRTLGIYMVTTFVAVALGLLMGTLIQPGAGFDTSIASAADMEKVTSDIGKNADAASAGIYAKVTTTLLSVIPTNPVEALAKGDVLQIIFFAILFGIGVMLAGEAGKPVANLINSAAEAVLKLTLIVMETAPYGVFALMAWVMADQGFGILANLGKMVLALYAACLLHMLITHGTLIKLIARLPLLPFFRGVVDAQALAFSTASSNATLPMTISCVTKNLGVSRPVASSVLPLGATINMDGTALYQGLIALFAAQALGIHMDAGDYMMIALMATLVSIGTAGVPSVSLLLATTTLGVIGVGNQDMIVILAVLFPFDRLLDMMRTVTNITGDAAVATVVGKWEGALDEEVYRAPDKV